MNGLFNSKSSKKFLISITFTLIFIMVSAICAINLYAATIVSGNFEVDYSVQNDWGTGCQVNMLITNNGPVVNSWNVSWTFSGDQQITNMWGATYTQSGSSVTIQNETWNGSISTNGSVSIGFTLTYSGTNAVPSNISVNNSTSSSTNTPTQTTAPSSTSPATSTPGSTEGTFHVFLLLGQSNMAGYPTPLASDKVEDDRILVLDYDSNQWRVAVPPLHESWNNAIGPGDWFSKTIVDRIPEGDTIGLIPCAISGEKIETFMKNIGSKYDWIIQRSRIAQQSGGVIEGMLFHQGESNNGDTNWPNNVNTFVTDLRTDLSLGNIPFLAGELLYSGGCAGHNVLVNQLPNVVSNCYVISAEGLVVDPADTQWNLHFSHDSQVTLGKRYAQKMIEVLGW